jgi:hypothetical protein
MADSVWGSSENPPSQSSPIDSACGIENIGTEVIDNLVANIWRIEKRMNNAISLKDLGPLAFKFPGYERLSGTDSPQKTNDPHR